ncbi:MAG: L,D-transpeptidase family protein [Chloroflexota bacterium]|nr:L,D-transpeptidase family protein [Chloroflexota bacterium]
MTNLTRREFLKLGGGALAGVASLPLPPRDRIAREEGRLGRITDWSVRVRAEPDHSAPTVRYQRRDDIVTYFEEVEAEGLNPHNPIWFRVIGGYVYSSYVQPVEIYLNAPLQHIPHTGLWGEISIPYTNARHAPAPDAYRVYRLRYSSVYRIAEAVWGADHKLWYRLYESQSPTARRYVPAEHVRPIHPQDMEPISPHVRAKRIEILLADQLLVAFENNRPVFETRISGGTGGSRSTPTGHHHIIFKAPSRHMVGDTYNLPGVPFDTYFWGAVAIHGAYWHNDFGRPRSHGCVNVLSEAAKWIFRWTKPTAPYEDVGLRVQEGGTPVIVS